MPGESKSIIGHYGSWASNLRPSPPTLSFRNARWTDPAEWRVHARHKAWELLAPPDQGGVPQARVDRAYAYDGLTVEELSWQLPYGRRTSAVLLKPAGTRGRLPAILALHDHGGNKYFGAGKITRTAADIHPLLAAHQEKYYGGTAWANEAARKGYVVLVHDAFAFGSRRVHYGDVEGIPWGNLNVAGRQEPDPQDINGIDNYNAWASDHENVMSKSLFCAGTTWPGVTLAEDRSALDILSAREDVDAGRIGCGGLSGGGLRTVYLTGLDDRINCAVCVGFMSTWDDFLSRKAYTHTWMAYTPLLSNYLEFSEIFGLRVPAPLMVLNNRQDQLFTLEEMEKADAILREIHTKAGASDRFRSAFHDGHHKFDPAMQKQASDWFDQWLK
ncbi:prolyl oligopeptidase family serine peptidase [Luteolibacter sp. SL250]|uniref:alpha/beta hydrolase family protein n=1 Tax=Luteolibacter sp. SL250 TaxID=2995170 RepID=UPI00226E1199|nr:prolyl oligopeptidase family serine peptidase [Luteolibacter sp. SL250]WAC19719.1 prolyl oligopeptidase family serine peptidase [Luteolibacter sp. SL250]